ncbi:MAG TPA: sigma-E factor negative regulatory protein [Burkholderiales bacterium]
MKEKLSALIDGEFQGDDLHSHLGRLRTDSDLMGAWDTYHLIGDALRGHVGPEIAGRVVARLSEEPTVLAPRLERSPSRRLGWYAMSAAASIAAVAFVVWTATPGWRADPQFAGNAPPAADAVPVATLAPGLPTRGVENYLLAHQPYSHTSAMQGIATYVRTVADGGEAARK